jgi:hypothetical protein
LEIFEAHLVLALVASAEFGLLFGQHGNHEQYGQLCHNHDNFESLWSTGVLALASVVLASVLQV